MARLPTVSGDADGWGGVLNAYLSVEHNSDGTLKNPATPLTDAAINATATTINASLARIDRVYDVRKSGATGTGSDDTAAIATSQVSAAAGATANQRSVLALAPGGNHVIGRRVGGSQTNGGIFLERGVSLDGQGATLTLSNNSAFVTNRSPLFTGDNDGATTTTATITANVAVSATTYTVNSTTGFSVGDDVMVRLNDNAWDAVETKDWFSAKVLTVNSGTSITLDRPSPAACTVGTTAAVNKVIRKLYERDDGGFVRNLTMIDPRTGSANAEAGIELRYVRNYKLSDITASNPGAGAILLAYSENVIASNIRINTSVKQGGQASKGRAINLYNVKNVRVENLYAEQFEGAAVMMESYCRGVVIDGMYVVNNHPTRVNSTTPILVVNQGSDVVIRNLLVEGTGGMPLIDESATTGNRIAIENLWLNTDTPIKGGLDLGYVHGTMRIGNTVYGSPIRRTVPFRIFPSMSLSQALPSGLYRSLKCFVTTTTGMGGGAGMYLVNGNSDTTIPTLTAGQLVSIGAGNQYGSDYPFNTNSTSKRCDLYTDATTPASGEWGFFEIEYWPSAINDGSKGRLTTQSLNPPTYTVTNLTVDRTYDADTATVAELSDIVGTLIADLKQSGWIA